jgi:hypothetical protein
MRPMTASPVFVASHVKLAAREPLETGVQGAAKGATKGTKQGHPGCGRSAASASVLIQTSDR